jgi:hypothetical protein
MRTIRKVNVLFLRAVGWMFAHELGHFARGHLDESDRILADGPIDRSAASALAHIREHEADEWAHLHATSVPGSRTADASICTIAFALGVIGGVCHVVTEDHPPVADRIRRFYKGYLLPLWDAKSNAYNTALYSAIAPLHALLYLNSWRPTVVQFEDFEAYLTWWETTMNILATPTTSTSNPIRQTDQR